MRTAVLLPGQGAQHVGMGRDLARTSEMAREIYDEADEILGQALSRTCWEGPEEELRRTENAQPAILLHSYATWRLLPADLRRSAVVAAGHSLGEFTAYLVAGALEFEDALRLVRRRGELMAESRGGTMAAVLGLDREEVADLCRSVEDGVVVPANINAPGQIVISGEEGAVERAAEAARERGARRVVPLQVSGAFHSPLMEVARDGLREALDATPFRAPRFPVVANCTAEPVTDADTARRLLTSQLTEPVLWTDSVAAMRASDPDEWLEVGPGRVLAGLLRHIDRSLEVHSVGEPSAIRELSAALSSAGTADA